MDKIVLDTNCLIISFARRSPYFRIWEDFLCGKFILCVTNEIVAEYEEILSQKVGNIVADNIIKFILNSSNTQKIETYYHFDLIKADKDDNKFVDCSIVAGAKYIVTEDHHFDILNYVAFPHVDVIGIDDFMERLGSM